MAKRTIYVREEDEAIFDRLAEEGNLSAVIARAVKGESRDPSPPLFLRGVEFSVDRPESVSNLLQLDPICLEVGRGLLSLVDPQQGAPLLNRIQSVRRHLAVEVGIVMCGVRLVDNTKLGPREYRIRIREVEAARGEVWPEHRLAVGSQDKLARLKGSRTKDPTYGMPARWIEPDLAETAHQAGCQVYDAVSVVATHLTHVVRKNAADLLGLQETEALLAPLRKTHPVVVNTAIPDCLSLVEVWQVLRGLLREQVPIRDLVGILEAIVTLPPANRHVAAAIEAARRSLSRQLSFEHRAQDGLLRVARLEPGLEERIPGALTVEERQGLRAALNGVPVLLTRDESRAALRALLPAGSPTVVLAEGEIWEEVEVDIQDFIGIT